MTVALEDLSNRELIIRIRRQDGEIERLKAAIRQHRDEVSDDRCWLDDERLYQTLGESVPDAVLPPREDFLKSCERYWAQRQTPLRHGQASLPGCMTIAQLTAEVERLRAQNQELDARLTIEADDARKDKAEIERLRNERDAYYRTATERHFENERLRAKLAAAGPAPAPAECYEWSGPIPEPPESPTSPPAPQTS